MNKITVALVALCASAVFALAAQAHDCDQEDRAEAAAYARGVSKQQSLRQTPPSSARQSAALRDECDADDAAEYKECMRRLAAPRVDQAAPAPGRAAAPAPAVNTAAAPAKKQLVDKVDAAPAAVASAERPAALSGRDGAPLCQKYFANVGQMVLVPCGE